MRAIEQGKVLGYYKILELLEPYPQLQVYKARDLEQHRVVCLLTPADADGKRAESIERLMKLVGALQWLDHPGVAQVYDHLNVDNRFYMVMEFIPGCNLETMLERMRLHQARPRFDEAMGIFQQILAAVKYLTDKGAPQRSLDPRWIHFRPDSHQGMPFCSVLTDPGAGYILPQPGKRGRRSGSEDATLPNRGDQFFELGVLLYRLATGNSPPGDVVVTRQHLSEVRPDLHGDVANIILRLLSRDPSEQFKHMDEIAAELMTVDSQVTQSTAGGRTASRPESLMSYYLDSLVKERSTTSVAPAEASEHDRIQINAPGSGKLIIPVNREGMTIGRVAGNDIVLNDLLVSRLHARIQYEGGSYLVIDLNSTNGTFLGKQKLLPGVAESWRPGVQLRVGDSILRLLPGKAG